MPREKDERVTERIVTLVTPQFKEDYLAMCEAIGENPSEHIRQAWELELELYKENQLETAQRP